MKKSKFAALFMAASIILAGCEIDESTLTTVDSEEVEYGTWEKSLKVGHKGDERDIEETNIFKEGESIGLVVDNGNESYGVFTMRIFLYKIDGDLVHVLSNTLADIDPINSWTSLRFEDLQADIYKVRIYIGEEYFGEVDFEVVEE